MIKTRPPEEHPWVVLRTRLSDTGWHNHRYTFATEEEARVIHAGAVSKQEPVSQLQHYVLLEDKSWDLETVDVRRHQ